MTKEEVIKAFEMRIDGLTYEEIGKHFNCSKQYVEQSIKIALSNKRNTTFPKLYDYIVANHTSFKNFAENIGISTNLLYQIMEGRRKVTVDVANRIISATGLNYEELFM